MTVTAEKNEKVAKMIFASIHPHYLTRVVKNGRTKEELNQIISWFTGFYDRKLQALIEEKVTFRTFFEKANTSKCTLDSRGDLWVSDRRNRG